MINNLANVGLERNFLNSIIQTDKFTEISELVRIEHFTIPAHITILNAIKKLEDVNTSLNMVVVAEEVMKIEPEHIEILKLVGIETATTDLKITVVQLVEWHNKRELYRLSLKIQENLNMKKSSASIVKIIDDSTINLDVAIGSRAKTYREHELLVESSPTLPVFQTGVSFIDDYLKGGITGGQLILVMGDPEAGKTILSTQILHNVSNGFPVLFFPFEFTVRDYISNNKKRKAVLNKDNLYIVNDGYDLSDVTREIKIWAKKGVRFVAIDSQMRVENTENNGTAEQMESEKFSRLAKLAHSLELVILFIAQQGKEDSKGGVHTPMGSKKGAHEASQIWYIHKKKPKYLDGSDKDENAHIRELEVSKNKQNGRHFRTEITLNPVNLKFTRKYNSGPSDMTEYNYDATSSTNEEIPSLQNNNENRKAEIPDNGLL
ncbi:MAG: DNA repair protein RadA/Sms [Arcobacteraceae bacterium]|jgi:DNA repair protein RadA/Sms